MTEEEKKQGRQDSEEDDDEELDLDDEEDEDDDSEEDEDDDDSDDTDEDEDEGEEEDDEDEDEEPRKKSKKIDLSKLSKEDLEKVAKSALRQKGKLKQELQDLKANGGSKKKKVKRNEEERSSNQINTERIEFRQDHPELRRKDVDQVERFAKANGMTMEKALKQPIVKSFVQKRLAKREAADASISNRSQGAPARRKGEKDWGAAPDADYQARRREILSRSQPTR